MTEETKATERPEEHEAAFNFTKMEYVHLIHFVAFEMHDFMMMIYTEKGRHFAKCRTRTYDREFHNPWSGLDRRQWWVATGELQALIDSARRFIKELIEGWGKVEKLTVDDEIIVDGPPAKAAELMSTRPWCHKKEGEDAQKWSDDYHAGRLPEQLLRARKEWKKA